MQTDVQARKSRHERLSSVANPHQPMMGSPKPKSVKDVIKKNTLKLFKELKLKESQDEYNVLPLHIRRRVNKVQDTEEAKRIPKYSANDFHISKKNVKL